MENSECFDVEMEVEEGNESKHMATARNGLDRIKEEKISQDMDSKISKDNIEKVLTNGTQKHANQYRLVIHIDKIRVKPGPKSKKLLHIRKIRNKLSENVLNLKDILSEENHANSLQNSQNSDFENGKSEQIKKVKIEESIDLTGGNEVRKKSDIMETKIESKTVGPSCTNGCKLETAIFNKKQIVYCSQCNKAYMQKRTVSEKKHRCLICHQIFDSTDILTEHIKQHSTCGTCGIECMTKDNLEKHTKLHIGRPPHFPFKCHLCTEVFRKEEHVRSHITNKHFIAKTAAKRLENTVNLDQQVQNAITQTLIEVQHPLKFELHRCFPCNITFRNEEAFQRHATGHKSKELYSPVKSERAISAVTSSFGQLCPVKFTCKVCSQEFTSVVEIDAHTKLHMNAETKQSLNCTMCDQVFTSSELLNEHVQGHMSRVFRCPICSKVFVNKATLKLHLKSHSVIEIS